MIFVNKKLIFIKIAFMMATGPLVMTAHEYGPDPFRTGAPGDLGTCLDSGCHSGPVLNRGGGTLKIVLPGANTYTPGVKQHIMIQIMDSAKQKFGFEMSARPASNIAGGQAGDFTSTDGFTQVICADARPKGTGCPSSVAQQFVEHNLTGYQASTPGGYTYQFDWTPPASSVGDINLYVAANAGPGGAPVSTGANVYTANVTLTATAAANAPSVFTSGVVPIYSTATTIQPGSWFSIYGNNLASAFTLWNNDFPTSLGGTTVTVNGKAAYLYVVSPGQINAQAPDDTATGSVPVVVTTAAGSTTSTVTLGNTGPSLLLLGDVKHATGLVFSASGTGGSQGGGVYDFLGPTSAGAGYRPAKKGEVIVLYGTGLGPTDSKVPAGSVYSCPGNVCAKLVTTPTVTIGNIPTPVLSATVAGAGLYQLIMTVPSNAPSGDLPVLITTSGLQTQTGIVVPVQ